MVARTFQDQRQLEAFCEEIALMGVELDSSAGTFVAGPSHVLAASG